jgi:hypothetical protein
VTAIRLPAASHTHTPRAPRPEAAGGI